MAFQEQKTLAAETGSFRLGEGEFISDSLMRIPVFINDAGDLRSFGFEFAYATDLMTFQGVRRTDMTVGFTALAGNEVEKGRVRVGGYGGEIANKQGMGVLVDLLFSIRGSRAGDITLLRLDDDLRKFRIEDRDQDQRR